jgi:uncharacterized protein (TIGR00725 family)
LKGESPNPVETPLGPYIGVIGESQVGPELADVAFQVGLEIARAGAVLVCGGLYGVMERAAAGARSAGGLTLGILPGTSRSDANPSIVLSVVTGLGEVRNLLVVRSSDAVVAVGGAYGTLSEIAFCLKLGVPVVGLKTWRMTRGDEPAFRDPVIRAGSPAEAVAQALRLARERVAR